MGRSQSGLAGRFLRPLLWAALAGLAFTLMSCGSPGPSKSFQQGWDHQVNLAGVTDCNAVPSGVASPSDWTKGCNLGLEAERLHHSGHPAAAPTTFPGNPR